MGNNNEFQKTPCTDECYVRISDLKRAIMENPYDPAKGEISAYLRYLKYNTPFRTDAWIPCSERLPENDMCRTLTTICTPYKGTNVRSGCFYRGLFMNDNGDTWNATDKEVLAWMPLPEAYGGGEDGNQTE